MFDLKERCRRGSYTVEAAVWIPVLVFLFVAGIRIGLYLYEEINSQKEQQIAIELWEVKDFYKNQWIGELTDD